MRKYKVICGDNIGDVCTDMYHEASSGVDIIAEFNTIKIIMFREIKEGEI